MILFIDNAQHSGINKSAESSFTSRPCKTRETGLSALWRVRNSVRLLHFAGLERGLAARFGSSIGAGVWPRAVANVDRQSLSALYSVGMDQRNDLLTELN